MKRFITPVAICALLLGAATAHANTSYKLNADGNWNTTSSWNPEGVPDNSTEDAYFTNVDGTAHTVTVTANATYADTFATTGSTVQFQSGYTLTTDSIDIDSASRAVTLTVSKTGFGSGTRLWDSVGNLDIGADAATNGLHDAQMTINIGVEVEVGSASSGDLRLYARPDTYAADAILQINGGTLDPQHDTFLYGGDPDATHGQAKLMLESTGTLAPPINLVMQGDARLEVRQAHNLSTTDMKVEPDTFNGYRTEAVIQVVTSGHTLTVDSVTIGGADYESKLTFAGSGSMVTN